MFSNYKCKNICPVEVSFELLQWEMFALTVLYKVIVPILCY